MIESEWVGAYIYIYKYTYLSICKNKYRCVCAYIYIHMRVYTCISTYMQTCKINVLDKTFIGHAEITVLDKHAGKHAGYTHTYLFTSKTCWTKRAELNMLEKHVLFLWELATNVVP